VALLPRVHVVLVRRTRSSPEAATRALDSVVASCSVRAKHGTKYHIVVSTEGLPLGVVASAANINTTPRCSPNCCASPWSSASRSRASPPLSRSCAAAAAGARDSGYDSADNRLLVNSESLVRRSLLGHGVKSTFWREPPENSQPQKHQSPHGGGQWLNRIA
jgi:hypothetical protein